MRTVVLHAEITFAKTTCHVVTAGDVALCGNYDFVVEPLNLFALGEGITQVYGRTATSEVGAELFVHTNYGTYFATNEQC